MSAAPKLSESRRLALELVGVPFERLDCLALCAEFLRRAGFGEPLAPLLAVPYLRRGSELGPEPPAPTGLEELPPGAPLLVGDLIETAPEGRLSVPGLAVVVESGSEPMVLTASHGAPSRLLPVLRLPNRRRVFRCRTS